MILLFSPLFCASYYFTFVVLFLTIYFLFSLQATELDLAISRDLPPSPQPTSPVPQPQAPAPSTRLSAATKTSPSAVPYGQQAPPLADVTPGPCRSVDSGGGTVITQETLEEVVGEAVEHQLTAHIRLLEHLIRRHMASCSTPSAVEIRRQSR